MDAYQVVVNGLNQLIGVCDQVDSIGIGAKAISNGAYTGRQACRLELSQFLIYVANAKGSISDTEAAVISVVLDQEYNAFQLKQVASTIGTPDPENSMTLLAGLNADKALNQQNGYKSTTVTDVIITSFQAFGELIAGLEDNAISKSRCARYISGMRSYVQRNL